MQESSRLRVAFRVGQFPSRTETFIAAQIEDIAGWGHRVTVLADGAQPQSADSSISSAHLRYVAPRRRSLARAFYALPYRLRRRAEIAAERSLCAQNDIVICNFGWAGAAVAASVAGCSRRARLVTVFHGDDMSRSLATNGARIYRQLFEEAALLLPVSDLWRRRLLELGAPEEKLSVYRMGVDPQRFPFAVAAYDPRQRFEIATLGRLVEKKGTATTLHALAQLRQIAPRLDFRFRIYGDGPLRDDLIRLRHELGLTEVVHFAGPVSHDAVRDVMASSHAFVLPSTTAADGDMEGIPIVLMEAMASGTPVVSTRHSGIPELIEDGVNGLLVEERDGPALARQLASLAADPQRRQRLAEAARRTIEQRFNRQRQGAKLNALLHDLVVSPPGPSPMAAASLGEA